VAILAGHGIDAWVAGTVSLAESEEEGGRAILHGAHR
jgi:hypothetical protein